MTDLSLPARMRDAADVMVEVYHRRYPIGVYGPEQHYISARIVRALANKWEAEDEERAKLEAKREALVLELATDLYAIEYPHRVFERSEYKDIWVRRARGILERGWGKV